MTTTLDKRAWIEDVLHWKTVDAYELYGAEGRAVIETVRASLDADNAPDAEVRLTLRREALVAMVLWQNLFDYRLTAGPVDWHR